MKQYIVYAAWGAIGGAARVVVGLLKAIRAGERVNVGRAVATLILSAAVGAFAGVLVDRSPEMASLAGYVGPDVIEGLVKASGLVKQSQSREEI